MSETIVRIDSCASATVKLEERRETLIAGVWTRGVAEKAIISLAPSGAGAVARVYILILGNGSDAFSFDVVADQSFPDTSIDIHIRSALYDRARIDSRGIMRIGKEACRSHSFYSHHALLASQGAHAKITPTLEIETDDVTAGHAVGIGTLDPEMLFYCASRGLTASHATSLIAQGFLLTDLIKKREHALLSVFQPLIEERFLTTARQ